MEIIIPGLIIFSTICFIMAFFSISDNAAWSIFLVLAICSASLSWTLMDIEEENQEDGQASKVVAVPESKGSTQSGQMICSPSEEGPDEAGNIRMLCTMPSAIDAN